MVLQVPKSINIRSFTPYPLPATVTNDPTVPCEGVISIILLSMRHLFIVS